MTDKNEIPDDIADAVREAMDILRGTNKGTATCSVEGCEAPGSRRGLCELHAEMANEIAKKDAERLCLENRLAEVDEMIGKSIGLSYVGCSWDNLEMDKRIVTRIRDAVGRGRSVIMSGEPGVGKTHIFTCILRDLFVAGENVEVWACSDLFDKLRDLAVEESPRVRSKFIQHFREVGWLFIDDLGVGKNSEFTLEQLFRIIDWRSRDDLPVIVTSNLTMKELADTYDARLSSRLAGLARRSGGLGIKIDGDDRRWETT